MIDSENECWELIVSVLTEVLEELGEIPDQITKESMLNADLGITSVDGIHMLVTLEDRLGMPLSFQELAVKDDEYIQDISAGDLYTFVARAVGLVEA